MDTSPLTFEYIYKKYFERLVFFVTRYVHDHDVAIDIVHDKMIYLWQHFNNFHVENSIKAWLYIACRNSALSKIQALEKAQIKIKYCEEYTYHIAEESIEASIIYAEILGECKNNMDLLPPKMRNSFEAWLKEPWRKGRWENICQRQQIAMSTFWSNVQKATHILRRYAGEPYNSKIISEYKHKKKPR